METLSKTERKVMQMRIHNGKSRKEIASETFRSELTIKTHFQNIMRKLDARDEIELTVKYLKKYRSSTPAKRRVQRSNYKSKLNIKS